MRVIKYYGEILTPDPLISTSPQVAVHSARSDKCFPRVSIILAGDFMTDCLEIVHQLKLLVYSIILYIDYVNDYKMSLKSEYRRICNRAPAFSVVWT